MSARRISVPGRPPVLIDEGPGFARSQYLSGELAVAPSKPPETPRQADLRKARYWADPEKRRAYQRERYRATKVHVPRCGAPMHDGVDVCARKAGHRMYHATRAAMDNEATRAQRYKAAA